jgi:hypothetical protein
VHVRTLATQSGHSRRSYRQHGVNGFGKMLPLARVRARAELCNSAVGDLLRGAHSAGQGLVAEKIVDLTVRKFRERL